LQTVTIEDAHRYTTRVACGILALVVTRIAIAAAVPLTFDEAYYWRLSQHLAGGYLDHPPMFAVIIRLGTLVAGDTPLGIRVVSVLLALPASWAVWRAAAILFRDDRLAATAALFFNLTLIVALGTVIVTPDSPLLVASAFVLFFLAKLVDGGAGIWWLAVGAAVGAGLLAKYSALFFGLSILGWLLMVPNERRWLLTLWPWLGALVALAIISPVLLWNADHDWDSFIFQFRRLAVDHFTLRYLVEFLPAQLGLATPSIFILGVMALIAFLAGRGAAHSARVLLGAMVWPLVIYLAWHALHQRVEGNWTAPIFPAFAIAAARAVNGMEWSGRWNSLADWSSRLAVPIGLAMLALIAAQAIFGLAPLGAADPTARVLGAGWPELGPRIDAIRTEIGAPAVLAENHALAGWLSFYLPSHPPVIQVTEQFRWVNEPPPSPELFKRPLLYISPALATEARFVTGRFRMVEKIASLDRQRRGVVIERYSVYRVAEPIGDPFDEATLRAWLARERLRHARQTPDRSENQ
jgi:4-amino-4-deoxy-L-arabinose transferase-like glycosyltransferase